MMKSFLGIAALVAVMSLAGCAGSSGDGDVERAMKGAAAAPKSVEQLPSDMPPQAKAAAASAMGQARAAEQQANDPARLRALQEMRKQSGR